MTPSGLLLVDALLALTEDDEPRARELAQAAVRAEPSDVLANAIADALGRDDTTDVYEASAAFEAFIDGGTNPDLYEATASGIAAVIEAIGPTTLLDIGCGDGRLTARLAASQPLRHIDLVEPAGHLLDRALDRLADDPAGIQGHRIGVERFLATAPPDRRWDLAVATFAAHTLDPPTRRNVFAELRARCDAVILAEFDLPPFDDGSREHAAYAVERYRRGVAEYPHQPSVLSHFLVPVLLRQLRPQGRRHTHEQPIQRWCEELLAAGFSSVRASAIVEYWWAPAALVVAS